MQITVNNLKHLLSRKVPLLLLLTFCDLTGPLQANENCSHTILG